MNTSCQKEFKGYVINLSSQTEEDLHFFTEVFGCDAVKKGYAHEQDRLYVLDNMLSDDEIAQKLKEIPPKSILDMPLPVQEDDEATQVLFTMPDETVVTWIKHPSALPEVCQSHWRDHLIHFQFINEKIGYEAHHSIHRFAIVEAADGIPRLFAPGGVRWVDYPTREAMISDVLDMSIAVSMKIEVVHTPSAGSKVAIRADKAKMPEVIPSLFAALERMGLVITAADLGITTEELDDYAVPVAPTASVPIGAYKDGIPSSLVTANGVTEGLFAMIKALPAKPEPKDVTVSIQGIGEVGYLLATRLLAKGVNVVIAEINSHYIARFKEEFAEACASGQAKVLDNPNDIYDVKADIFCPCALRDILNEATLPRFKAAGIKMIGGPANNIFSDQVKGPWLFQNEGILVVPYEGIGAGGVTGVSHSIMVGFFGYCPFSQEEKVKEIGYYIEKILHYAHKYNLPAQVISDRILINGVTRRTFFDHTQAKTFVNKLAEAFTIGGNYEHTFKSAWTKQGFFEGKGKFPEGGHKYL